MKVLATLVATLALAAGCGGGSSAPSAAEKACNADLTNLPAAYKLARHAGLGLGPNIYLAMHAPTKTAQAAALQRFEDTCKQVAA